MESLPQPIQKNDLIPLVTQGGRMVRVNLILLVVVDRMPHWLGVLLVPHTERFAQE